MADPTFTAVDLSRLPAPDIIETLDYEALLARAAAPFRAAMAAPGVTIETRDSYPVMKLLQTCSYFAQLLRQRVNDAARAIIPAYARGADLGNIAALFGIMRLTITPADAANGNRTRPSWKPARSSANPDRLLYALYEHLNHDLD